MIQFNLLPDVKIEAIKARYHRRIIVVVSVLASGLSLLVFVLLFLYVRVNQTGYIKDLDRDITTNMNKVQSVQDLDKVLTIQNQLNSLPDLHNKKVISSRFIDYLTKLVPNDASLESLGLDFNANTMNLSGHANDLPTVNKFVDTLKFTTYKVNDSSQKEGMAFSNVVLESFSIAPEGSSAQGASFKINLTFEPSIFANLTEEPQNGGEAVSLKVPNIISTRSETEKPSTLFTQKQSSENKQGQGQ